ncbi:hypothetical protein BDZ94DRAFT_1152957 [Collybia nuda]|uniref:Ubiquitin-like domain-containing protein n=1 Tax=Collybia nuda TaxID=64659 RepID=A0A9P5YJL0_9AGAR|nr:hypothetical protein BDZ94DRAFT_1152957 [Collybia nuda]
MSLVELRVELPAYAHSFIIQVHRSCAILDVKREIFRTCVGGPKVDGQRIIWRGRYLADHEKVDEIWKSHDEPRIVHLAVHPSAWSSAPPEVTQPIQPVFTAANPPGPINQVPPQHVPVESASGAPFTPTAITAQHPLAYVLFKHQNALIALMQGSIVYTSPSELDTSRLAAVQAVESHGWSWPVILDEEFPAASEGGLKYESITVAGQSFLSLCSSEAPTALQSHALKVLTYTFTLLSIPTTPINSNRTIPSQTVPIPPNVNIVLQQLGLPQLRMAQNQNAGPGRILPELREMPLRPLLAPLLMLLFRTMLLLYFVAPARKPIFGILILAWMLYEIWRPIRNGLIRGLRHAGAGDRPRQNAPAAQVPNPIQNGLGAEAPIPPPNGPGGTAAAQLDNQAAMVINTLGNMNIATEDRILNDVPETAIIQPGAGHKLMTFFSLLLTTIHPAIWNQRRIALRNREGRIRTEANLRNAPQPDTESEDTESENRTRLRSELRAQYERRPRWVRNYMDRVVTGDWVDDAD